MNDPVLLLGLAAFACLLIALPLAFWGLSGRHGDTTSRVVQLHTNSLNIEGKIKEDFGSK